MVQMSGCQLILMCFTIRLVQQSTGEGQDSTGRVTEYNDKSVRKHDIQSFSGNMESGGNKANSYDFSLKDSEMLHDDSIDRAALVGDSANLRSGAEEGKTKEMLGERPRTDGFKVTTPEEHPYAVLIYVTLRESRVTVCSGSLIAPRWVITSAVCFKEDFRYAAVYAGGNSVAELSQGRKGVNGSQVKTSRDIYTHEHFYSETLQKLGKVSIALMKMEEDFSLTDTVNTIELSLKPWRYRKDDECQLTSFGAAEYVSWENATQSDSRKTRFLHMDRVCKCFDEGGHVHKYVVCAKPEEGYGICTEDVGGGLICGGKLVAVASSIITYSDIDRCTVDPKAQGCARYNTLSVFQQVHPHHQWFSACIGRDLSVHSVHTTVSSSTLPVIVSCALVLFF